jgi:hypothetical protein
MPFALHSDEIVNTRKHDWKTKQPNLKLKCIVDYSYKMGAVDQTDMLLSYVQCIQKSVLIIISSPTSYAFSFHNLNYLNYHVFTKDFLYPLFPVFYLLLK